MLIFTNKIGSGVTALPDKYISAQSGANTGIIVYTVPENRKFVGYWYGTANGLSAFINGVSANSSPDGTAARGHVPVTMGPLFTFAGTSTNIFLIGVESDA
jgi:hypothetical protein